MNTVTAVVFAVFLLFIGGAAEYVWNVRRLARSRWLTRFHLAMLVFAAAYAVFGLAMFGDERLTGNFLLGLCLIFWWTTQVIVYAKASTQPRDSMMRRYPYRPTKRDRRLIWLTFAALGVPVVAVLAVVVAHNVG